MIYFWDRTSWHNVPWAGTTCKPQEWLSDCVTGKSWWAQLVTSWIVRRYTPFLSQTIIPTAQQYTWPWDLGTVMHKQEAFFWKNLPTDLPAVCPKHRGETPLTWPTLTGSFDPHATEHWLVHCTPREDGQEQAQSPSSRRVWKAESQVGFTCTIWSCLPCWCRYCSVVVTHLLHHSRIEVKQ